MLIKKKGYCEIFKRQDSNDICFIKKQLIVKLFQGKVSNELCLLKKGYCETF